MKKKKNKKKLSVKELSSLNKIGKEFAEINANIKKHGTANIHAGFGLLECESDVLQCEVCFWEKHNFFECDWFRENKCTYKCNFYSRNVDTIGFVDANKIKHHKVSKEEASIRSKVKKYIRFAEKIDEVYEIEEEKIRKKKEEEMVKQRMQELKEQELEEKELDTKNKRRNLKSLI